MPNIEVTMEKATLDTLALRSDVANRIIRGYRNW
jgi:hypothetical protein